MSVADLIRSRRADLQKEQSLRVFWFTEAEPPFLVLDSNMTDTYHDITVYLKVDLRDFRIMAIEIDEKRAPFRTCAGATGFFDRLIGAPVQYHKIRELLGPGRESCLRINEVILYAAEHWMSALGYHLKYLNFAPGLNDERMDIPGPDHETRQNLVRHWWMQDAGVADTCHSFNTELANPEYVAEARKHPAFSRLLINFRKKTKGPATK